MHSVQDLAMLDERAELLELLLQEEGLQDVSARIPRRWPHVLTAPLSFAQQRLWFFDRLDPESPAYNMAGTARLKGDINFPVLCRALQDIVRRHEILRTTFVEQSGAPQQNIGPTWEIAIPLTDLQDFAPEDRAAVAARLSGEEARLPFNLATGPLIRVSALALAPKEYLLLVTMHHIVSDGWSLSILTHELSATYTSFLECEPSPLPELPLQYADFAMWQRSEFENGALAEQLLYWKTQLAAESSPLPLPFDRPRTATPSAEGKRRTFPLPRAVIARLDTLSARENATLYMTMLAAFFALLHRYTAAREGAGNDILVGSLVANRNRPGLEELIGFFVNTLVLRARVESHMPFIELLRQVRDTCLDAYANQDLPFDKLVEELAPARGLNITPLFQILFAFQNLPTSALRLPGLEVELVERDSGAARFDLVFDVKERSGELELIVTYRTALFEEETIDRMAGHYVAILNSIADSSEQRISSLRLLTRAEEHRILYEWNKTDAPFPDMGLHELFEQQVRRSPEATAIVWEDESLSYGQVDAAAARFAARLQSFGVTTGTVVAVAAERSLSLVPAIIGILKSGGVYLPIDPEHPADRITFMLEQAGAGVLMTQSHLRGLAVSSLPRLYIDEPESDYGARFQPSDVRPDDLAYTIFTSGSTGEPKGVTIQHRGIVNRVCWQARLLSIGPGDRILYKTPLTFDVSIGEIFLPLVAGATLVVAASGKHWDPEYLANLIHRQGVTFAHFVPAMLRVFLETEEVTEKTRTLREVWSGGEALTPELRKRFFERIKANLHNGYGPTEASVGVLHERCSASDPASRIYLGRPIANAQCYITDPDLNLVPAGVAGEIVIGGVPLARGYLGDPELTGERFIQNPFKPRAGERVYKTGDVGRYAPDGRIEFIGRRDQQIKLRGFRVELGEIEAALKRHPTIQSAVVLVANEQLCAYCITRAEEPPGARELKDFVRTVLPAYMIPANILLVPDFPLTANGKIDTRALLSLRPAPDQIHPPGEPGNETEQLIANIWKSVLGVNSIDLDENFFDAGGHSLLMIQMQSRLNETLPRKLTLIELFTHPTIRQLAGHLSGCSNEVDDQRTKQVWERGLKQKAALLNQRERMRRNRHSSGPVLLEKPGNLGGQLQISSVDKEVVAGQ